MHSTKIIDVLQTADGLISVCISCCGLHGEWCVCTCCGGCPDGCDECNRIFLEPHPMGGQYPITQPGYVKDPDTRSWNVFSLVAHDGNVSRVRTKEELQEFIDFNHKRISDQHEAAVQAVAHVKTLKERLVHHDKHTPSLS